MNGDIAPIVETTIAQLHEHYLRRRSGVRAVVEAHLARIAAFDKRGPYLNAVITLAPNARAEADRQDLLLARTGVLDGALFGVPVVVKDNVEVAGMPMTAGFQGWKHNVPAEDAPVIERIRRAGGIIVAKTSMSEFARGGHDNINSVLPGFARNPYHTAYSTGGSSGGSAAALAASFAVVGVGTDTGGSIRMPSAHCALVGLRPSTGLIDVAGVVPLVSARDTVGPMGRSVRDLAVAADVMAGGNAFTGALDPQALRGARLGVFRAAFEGPYTDPAITAHFEQTLDELRGLGAVLLDPFDVTGFGFVPRPPQTPAQMKRSLQGYLDAHPATPWGSVRAIADSGLLHPLYQRGFEEIADAGEPETDPATLTAVHTEERYRLMIGSAMTDAGVDALVLPTWAMLPAVNGDRNTQMLDAPFTGAPPFPEAGPTTFQSSLTYLASALRWPALAVPSGYLSEGLPTGIQLIGKPDTDARLVGWGYAYERATGHRRPPDSTPALPLI